MGPDLSCMLAQALPGNHNCAPLNAEENEC